LWRRPDDIELAWQEVSRVAMSGLSDQDIDTYLATRTWQGCSGAYAILEENDPYVRVISGSMSNVIGLPMETTNMVLRWFAEGRPASPGGRG
jgi:septum formation protein